MAGGVRKKVEVPYQWKISKIFSEARSIGRVSLKRNLKIMGAVSKTVVRGLVKSPGNG